MSAERYLVWESGVFRPAHALEQSASLLVADSWLVDKGGVIAPDKHFARFQTSCQAQTNHPPSDIEQFWQAVLRFFPKEGRWFPRVELILVGDQPCFALRVRGASPPSTEVRLVLSTQPDPRQSPGVKGPDLELLGRLRQEVIAQGGDEGVLISPEGLVREGLTTSLVWWEGHTLCLPALTDPVLPGITRQLVVEIAKTLGTPIAYRRVRQADLHKKPLWALNALHGIRQVVEIFGETSKIPLCQDIKLWQSVYYKYRMSTS